MANSYTQVSPECGMPVTLLESVEISEALLVPDDVDDHGFEFYREGELGYLIASEYGQWSEIPTPALELIGAVLTRLEWRYWEFGAAFTSNKMLPGEFGGTAFRIMPDGSIVERVETWP